jgi:branched-chain amino acid transport system permease protein
MNTFYAGTLLVYAAVDVIACLALNLQFGVSGIVNFSFIVFQSIGAYTAAVLSMPPDTAAINGVPGGWQFYIGGLSLPFPIPWVGGAVAGGLLAIPVGLVVLRKLRADYQAISLLVLSVIVNSVIMNARPFLNGAAGISMVPGPFSDQINPLSDSYQLLYVGLTVPCVLLVWLVASRIVNSPFGRSLRAMREHEVAATAIGKNPTQLKMTIFIVGGVIAGLSGAILVGYIAVWAPSEWLYPETIILFAAVIVGGRGNNVGAMLGALLVPVGFFEVTRLIPAQIAGWVPPPNLISAMEWVAIGLLIIGFLWFRPEGVRPEPRRVFEGAPVREDVSSAGIS